MSDPFEDIGDSISHRISSNLHGSKNMDRASLDYYHPDGDGYNKSWNVTKNTESAVITSIREIDVPSEILDQAIAIFNKTGVKEARKKKKQHIVFACIYNAALSQNYAIFTQELAEKCGMKKCEITSAMTTFGKCANKELIVSAHIPATSYIFKICESINAEALTGDVTTVVNDVIDRQPSLEDKPPKLVAAGAIHYWANILEFEGVTKESISKNTGLTVGSIEKMSKEIAHYHNDC